MTELFNCAYRHVLTRFIVYTYIYIYKSKKNIKLNYDTLIAKVVIIYVVR